MIAGLFFSVFSLLSVSSHAQNLTYTKGQNVAPAYEGWEQASDGTKYFLFGYMNRNWEGEKDELIWTLTSHGKTEKAYASLRPDYVVDDVVKASETGALGAGTSSPEVRGNKPPTVHIEEVKARSVKIGETITVVSDVKDDGIPKRRPPSAASLQRAQAAAAADPALAATLRNPAMSPPTRITVGKNLGLHTSWFVYRQPVGAKVTFDPPQVKAWEDTRAGANSPWAPQWTAMPIPADGKQPVQVSFSAPGTYVLHCRADDGALVADDEVTIAVVR